MDITSYIGETSTLPPGGNPAMDAAYERWLRATCRRAQMAMLDRHWLDLPPADFLPPYQLHRHLLKHLEGRTGTPRTATNFNHTLRLMAIQFHYRSAEIAAEAARYVAEQAAIFEAKHYPEVVAS